MIKVLNWVPSLSGTKTKKAIVMLIMAQLLFTNFSRDSAAIGLNRLGNGPTFDDYVEVAKWARNNLPEDAFVLSVKPRIFWLYSNKKGSRSTTDSDVMDDQLEESKLATWKKIGATHIVIDRISRYTRTNIAPIVQNNPKKFRTVYVAQNTGTCAIVKILDN